MSKVAKVTLRRLRLPLVRPYRLPYRTFEEFEPFLVDVDTDDGRSGFADGHISPGSSSETREGGWSFLTDAIKTSLGRDTLQHHPRLATLYTQFAGLANFFMHYDGGRYRQPLFFVCVQQRVGSTPEHTAEFPTKIVSVLYPGVHALSAGGRVDMGGISGEKNSSVPVAGHHPYVWTI